MDYDVQSIDSATYFATKRRVNPRPTELKKITDLEQVKRLLGDRITWWEVSDDVVEWITTPDGKAIPITGATHDDETERQPDYDYGWSEGESAYYPDEDILLLIGGHQSEIGVNLTTGDVDVGNPSFITFSPSKMRRWNGDHDGQDCGNYFIEEKIGGHYRRIIEMEGTFRAKSGGESLCQVVDEFLEDDLRLYIAVGWWGARIEDSSFYQITLK